MSSSLVMSAAGTGELLPTNPNTPGLHVGLDYDLGDPQLVTAAVEALLLDGERVQLTRVGNRTIELPVIVKGSSRADLTARVDALVAGVTAEGYTLTWTPDAGLPLVWDCFPAQATVRWDVRLEDVAFGQQVDLSIPALPYGRSPDAVTPDLTETGSGVNARLYTLGGLIGSAPAPAAAALHFTGGVDAWLLHRPPADADPAAPILNALTSGAASVGSAELLRGTYTVVLCASTYGAPGEDRVVTVTVAQDGTGATETIGKAYTSALNLRHLDAGNITLPLVDRPPGAPIDLTITVDDSGGSDFHSVLLIDTRGQTVQSLAQVDGVGLTIGAWADAPDLGAVIGPVWNSPSADRDDAYASPEPRVSGGALTLSATDEGGALLLYSAGANPDEPVVGYYPRWLAERVE